jgi:hypothetical protein
VTRVTLDTNELISAFNFRYVAFPDATVPVIRRALKIAATVDGLLDAAN